MKLLRYGEAGSEKPGLLDADGNIRDLSAHTADLKGNALSNEALAKLKAIDPASLPLVEGNPRIGPCARAAPCAPLSSLRPPPDAQLRSQWPITGR